jgi:hypothetical protein
MPDTPPKPELLRSLGRLARGLSALFWGLPAALVICVETAKTDWLKPLGIIPALAAIGLLLYGLRQMSDFQKQERPWRNALDRAKLLALVNLGLCPFLYWHNKMPQELFFIGAVFMLVLSAAIFLFNLNIVLKQLAAMLPEETLRHEMRLFTALNRWLIVGLLLLSIAYVILTRTSRLPLGLDILSVWFDQISLWLLIFFALLPLAITMALIWKTKEIILDSVFGARQ